MNPATSTLNVTHAATHTHAPHSRPFFVELLSLIARVFAVAIAINIVFAAFVLLLAGNAEAGQGPASADAAQAAQVKLPPGRNNRCAASLSDPALDLALFHRLGAGPMPRVPLTPKPAP